MVLRVSPLLMLLLAAPALAAGAARPLEDACSSEIGVLCRRLAGARLLACLEAHETDAMRPCREAIGAERDRLAAARAEREAAAQEAKVRAEQGDEEEARLVKAAGSVYVRAAGADARWVAAEPGLPLLTGDFLRTGADGSAEVAVEGRTILMLGPDADLIVNSLHPDETELYLGAGRLAAAAGAGPLRLATPVAAALTRGGELAVEHAGGVSRVAVFDEGGASVSLLAGGAQAALGPGQETEVRRSGPVSPPGPLSALLPAKPAALEARRRLAEVRKDWRPQPARPRAVRRLELSRKPALGPDLAGVAPARLGLEYAEARERQRQIRARLDAKR